jgi:hypothetical protein
MARNFVEYHIQDGAFHTFKVASGETIKIGQLVQIAGDRTVEVADGTKTAIGVVYSGTVGKDGLGVGYVGDEGDVVTVVALKPLVYLEAGGNITAGALLKASGSGQAVAIDTATGNGYDAIGVALEAGSLGNRFLAMLG